MSVISSHLSFKQFKTKWIELKGTDHASIATELGTSILVSAISLLVSRIKFKGNFNIQKKIKVL